MVPVFDKETVGLTNSRVKVTSQCMMRASHKADCKYHNEKAQHQGQIHGDEWDF